MDILLINDFSYDQAHNLSKVVDYILQVEQQFINNMSSSSEESKFASDFYGDYRLFLSEWERAPLVRITHRNFAQKFWAMPKKWPKNSRLPAAKRLNTANIITDPLWIQKSARLPMRWLPLW